MIRLKLDLLRDRSFDWQHTFRAPLCNDGAAMTQGHSCNAQ